jgi:hypothetical protein
MEPAPATPTPKRPWEIYVVCGILCIPIAILSAVAVREPAVLFLVAGLVLMILGLLIRSGLAWWTNLVVAALFTWVCGGMAWQNFRNWGLRWHRALWPWQLALVLSAAVLGLLLSVFLRKAYGPPRRIGARVGPVAERILKVVLIPVAILIVTMALSVPAYWTVGRADSERNRAANLKTHASAEADFRGNDRDGNGVQDFWTGDVQGLYAIVPKGGSDRIKLLDLSAALSDSDPLRGVYPPLPESASPRGGGWVWALAEDRSVSPPDPYRAPERFRHPERFGFLCYPDDDVTGGRAVFIMNEANTILRQRPNLSLRPSDRTPPGPVTAAGFTSWPSEADLKANWIKLD